MVAVLAGGRGSRIGGSKAVLPLAGRPLLAYPLAAAAQAGLPAVVVAKPGTQLPPLGEAVLLREPELPIHPLLGALTAIDHAARSEGSSAVILTSCDMPFLTGPLLAWLAGLGGSAVASLAGRAQPLLSRLQDVDREALRESLEGESSLTRAIEALGPTVLGEAALAQFGDPLRICFSVNDPEDLATAERWLASEG